MIQQISLLLLVWFKHMSVRGWNKQTGADKAFEAQRSNTLRAITVSCRPMKLESKDAEVSMGGSTGAVCDSRNFLDLTEMDCTSWPKLLQEIAYRRKEKQLLRTLVLSSSSKSSGSSSPLTVECRSMKRAKGTLSGSSVSPRNHSSPGRGCTETKTIQPKARNSICWVLKTNPGPVVDISHMDKSVHQTCLSISPPDKSLKPYLSFFVGESVWVPCKKIHSVVKEPQGAL